MRQIWNTVVVGLSFLVVFGAFGCMTNRPNPAYLQLLETQSNAPTAGSLGGGDAIKIRVHGEKDLSDTYTVSSNGTITFPFLGQLEVEGRTCRDVEQMIQEGLAEGYLKEPDVSCAIDEYNSKRIYVFGEVKEPGPYAYTSKITLVEAVAMAGGTRERAAPNSTLLTRELEDRKIQVEVPFQEIVEGRQPNFRLYPGDIVFIPESAY